MKRSVRLTVFLAVVLLAVLLGIFIGDGRGPAAWWRDLREGRFDSAPGLIAPEDPALLAKLPVPDPAAGLPPSPLNALLKAGLTPQEQTDIIGQMLLDYWTNLHTLPAGTWEETCAQLAGANKKQLALIPQGHPALGRDSFRSAAGAPGIRLHVVSSSGGAFQLIYDGPDGKPYTDDDLIRNFPPDLDFR